MAVLGTTAGIKDFSPHIEAGIKLVRENPISAGSAIYFICAIAVFIQEKLSELGHIPFEKGRSSNAWQRTQEKRKERQQKRKAEKSSKRRKK